MRSPFSLSLLFCLHSNGIDKMDSPGRERTPKTLDCFTWQWPVAKDIWVRRLENSCHPWNICGWTFRSSTSHLFGWVSSTPYQSNLLDYQLWSPSLCSITSEFCTAWNTALLHDLGKDSIQLYLALSKVWTNKTSMVFPEALEVVTTASSSGWSDPTKK